MYLFIWSLYMFRASQCSSSGDRIVLIHHLVWLVCVSDCLVCRLHVVHVDFMSSGIPYQMILTCSTCNISIQRAVSSSQTQLHGYHMVTEYTLSLVEQTHLELGHIGRSTIKTTLQHHIPLDSRNSAPLPPTDPCSSLDRISSDYLICIHILLICSRSRHHSYEGFFAHCTQLLLRYYVQPDGGHHKGRNM